LATWRVRKGGIEQEVLMMIGTLRFAPQRARLDRSGRPLRDAAQRSDVPRRSARAAQ
jgi:hypothetical protein